ncbi:MAG: hypothetical protein A2X32_08455 [Elusimicrobia bacterium GWC2_64_44]|nr:MAG: hypothetical protein A2X32_08455 [Elusimicrobia bacterium GWC2_64_44]
MNTKFKKISAAVVCLVLLAVSAQAGGNPYRGLSEDIARAAAANAVKKIAVLGFEGRGGAGRNECAYVAELVGTALSATKKVSLIERSLLDGVLKEARLSSSAGGEGPDKELFSVDAVVTGMVFPEGDCLKVFIKLIEVRTGRVLLSKAAQGVRLAGGFMETMSDALDLPDVPMPEASDIREVSMAASGLRDSVAEPAAGACVERRMLLASMNAELVAEKALFWAAKMREPGFSLAKLRRNPGSEISDRGVRSDFYKLLKKYYAEGYSSGPGADSKGRLARLLWLEEVTAAECGGVV